MINFSILVSSSEVSGPGGLFDIDATLPLVAIQFLLLMVILNIILYNPLIKILDEREAELLNNRYLELEFLETKEKIKADTIKRADNTRKFYDKMRKIREGYLKSSLQHSVRFSASYVDDLFTRIPVDINAKKKVALNDLEEIVESLCDSVETSLAI